MVVERAPTGGRRLRARRRRTAHETGQGTRADGSSAGTKVINAVGGQNETGHRFQRLSLLSCYPQRQRLEGFSEAIKGTTVRERREELASSPLQPALREMPPLVRKNKGLTKVKTKIKSDHVQHNDQSGTYEAIVN